MPVGLNYFSGHRFRSRVFLDIGEPFAVPRELAKLYATGGENKHEATARLMELVESALATVTISAPDASAHSRFCAKDSYLPEPMINLDEKVRLPSV